MVAPAASGPHPHPYPHPHLFPISVFEAAVAAAGMDFRSDKLWELYVEWEREQGDLRAVTGIYDRVLSMPTQLYNHHWEKYMSTKISLWNIPWLHVGNSLTPTTKSLLVLGCPPSLFSPCPLIGSRSTFSTTPPGTFYPQRSSSGSNPSWPPIPCRSLRSQKGRKCRRERICHPVWRGKGQQQPTLR